MTALFYLDPNPIGRPPILLLHGLGATSSSWLLQMEALIAAGLRPLAPDAPGFGGSPYDGHGWSIRRASGQISALMQELAVRRAYVLGISMGGVLAQQLALDHPELVERLILVNTFPYLRPDTFTGWLYYVRRAVLVFTVGIDTQAKLVAQHLFPEPGQEPIREELIREISSADPRAYRGAMRALGLFDSRGRLGEIQAPTLVISGDQDTTVPLRNQQLLVKGISGCKHVILRGAGHAASVDKPDEFNRAVLDFLMDGH